MKIYTVQATAFDLGNFATTVDKGDFNSYDEAYEHIVTLSTAGCPADYNVVVREVDGGSGVDVESAEKARKLKKFRSEVAARMGWEPADSEVDDVLGIVKALHERVEELRGRVEELEEYRQYAESVSRCPSRVW